MKLLSLVFLLTSFSTLACPDLAGRYSCSDDNTGEQYETVISQRVENGATVYSDEENMKIVTDGKEHPLKLEEGFVATARFECVGSTTVKGQFYIDTQNGRLIGDMVVEKVGQDMSTTTSMYIGGQSAGYSQTLCTRM